jgi:diguanylate cyclase (GGDEF)-like protein/PAS domain S-box-containing protein
MEMDSEEPRTPANPADPGFYKELLDHMSDGVYFVDRERRILYWNEGAYRLTGYTADELIGRKCEDDILCHVDTAGRRLCKEDCPLTATIKDGGPHEASVFLRHKLGRRIPVQVRVQPLRAADGSVVGAIEIFSDDSAQNDARQRTKSLERLAFLDHLTQLPNRRFLEMTLQTALNEFQVHGDPFGILSIDLDGFKAINDNFGHACGDRALQEAGKTLAASLRPTDTVGRWGGDEFLAIVRNVSQESLESLAQRCVVLLHQTSVPLEDGKRIPMSISVGAALVQPGETADNLVERADKLMYQCKAADHGRIATE